RVVRHQRDRHRVGNRAPILLVRPPVHLLRELPDAVRLRRLLMRQRGENRRIGYARKNAAGKIGLHLLQRGDLLLGIREAQRLGTTYAGSLAEHAEGRGELDTPEGYLVAAEQYVDGMFAGKKSALRPIYDKLLSLGLSLGADVKACPCKTIVPLYRKHVFAQ